MHKHSKSKRKNYKKSSRKQTNQYYYKTKMFGIRYETQHVNVIKGLLQSP